MKACKKCENISVQVNVVDGSEECVECGYVDESISFYSSVEFNENGELSGTCVQKDDNGRRAAKKFMHTPFGRLPHGMAGATYRELGRVCVTL